MARRVHPALAALPHLLTASRLAIVGVTYTVVPDGSRSVFVGLVLLAVATDMLDGPLARKLGVASKLGANFDSLSDFVFYASLLVWAYMYEPGVMTPLTPVVVLVFLLYVVTLAIARIRRGGLIGFHNRWSRLSATFGVVFAIYVVGWGWNVILAALLIGGIVADLWQRARALLGLAPGGRAAASS